MICTDIDKYYFTFVMYIGKCPNITCFRCGQFGHHSKVCTLPKMSSVVVCSRCGSNTHDTKQCNASADEKAIENDGCIRCMMCNALGHAICKPIGKLPHRYVTGCIAQLLRRTSLNGRYILM